MGRSANVRSFSAIPLCALALALVLAGSCAGGSSVSQASLPGTLSQAPTAALPVPGGRVALPAADSVGRAAVPADITQALSQLDAMPCPKGVSRRTWAELTGALGEALAGRLQVTGDRLQVGAASSHSSSSGKVPPLPVGRTAVSAKAASELALSPPVSPGAQAHLLYEAAMGLIRWGLYCPGDCDQNGAAGLSDLVPLAVHFGESTGAGNPFPPGYSGAQLTAAATGAG